MHDRTPGPGGPPAAGSTAGRAPHARSDARGARGPARGRLDRWIVPPMHDRTPGEPRGPARGRLDRWIVPPTHDRTGGDPRRHRRGGLGRRTVPPTYDPPPGSDGTSRRGALAGAGMLRPWHRAGTAPSAACTDFSAGPTRSSGPAGGRPASATSWSSKSSAGAATLHVPCCWAFSVSPAACTSATPTAKRAGPSILRLRGRGALSCAACRRSSFDRSCSGRGGA